MAMRITKLVNLSGSKFSAFRFILTKPNVAALLCSRPFSNISASQNADSIQGEDDGTGYQEFQMVQRRGLFRKSACIDPSARIEIGAMVHLDSVVGANVYVGSGSIVGPAVRIGLEIM